MYYFPVAIVWTLSCAFFSISTKITKSKDAPYPGLIPKETLWSVRIADLCPFLSQRTSWRWQAPLWERSSYSLLPTLKGKVLGESPSPWRVVVPKPALASASCLETKWKLVAHVETACELAWSDRMGERLRGQHAGFPAHGGHGCRGRVHCHSGISSSSLHTLTQWQCCLSQTWSWKQSFLAGPQTREYDNSCLLQ